EYGGVRLSFMLSDMAELAHKHEPAKKAFAAILAELQGKIDAASMPTFEDWQEWKSFCNYFGESARILAWYEKRRDANGALLEDHQDFVADLIRDQVFDALIDAKRPADAVRLLADARARAQRFVKEYESIAATAEQMGEKAGKDMVEHFQGKLLDDL